MLLLLDQNDDTASLMDTAHTLASAAGMFGFQALSVAARSFENALDPLGGGTGANVRELRQETLAALAILGELVRENGMQPA